MARPASLAENIPPWVGGEPSSVPSPSTQPPQSLDVSDVPQARPVKAMDADDHGCAIEASPKARKPKPSIQRICLRSWAIATTGPAKLRHHLQTTRAHSPHGPTYS